MEFHGMLLMMSLVAIVAALPAPLPLKERLATIEDRYIIVFENNVDVDEITSRLQNDVLAFSSDFQVTHRYYRALKGIGAKLDRRSKTLLERFPGVKYIEKDTIGHVSVVPEAWGLDRVDQRDLPYDNDFTIQGDGAGVNVYVLDTGIRETHNEFRGRAVRDTTDFVGDDWSGIDCHGHGTHCAGTAAGSIHGIARAANIIGIRIFTCEGAGAASDAIAAYDYLMETAVLPAVVSMSFGFLRNQAINDAVDELSNMGVIMVAAAGNSDIDACFFSPAGAPTAITVAASDINDQRASFSDFGPCVDLYAPGVAIKSSSPASDEATATWSGTSMACPHVAGAAAIHLGNGVPASEVRNRILADATMNKIYDSGFDTPNKLLYLD